MQVETATSHKEIEEIKERFKSFNDMYEDLTRLTKEMRNGRSMRIEQDLENRKMVIETDSKVDKLASEVELLSKNIRAE